MEDDLAVSFALCGREEEGALPQHFQHCGTRGNIDFDAAATSARVRCHRPSPQHN